MCRCTRRIIFFLIQDEGTARTLRLAEYVNVPLYVVHVMSAGAADEVARAKRAGQRVVGEAVASGFASEERMVWHPDFKARALEARAYILRLHAMWCGGCR